MPQDVVVVEVGACVEDSAVLQRLFEELPADEVGASI